MLSQGSVTAAYIAASILFILSLSGLAKQETAKGGVVFGVTGIAGCDPAQLCRHRSGFRWLQQSL